MFLYINIEREKIVLQPQTGRGEGGSGHLSQRKLDKVYNLVSFEELLIIISCHQTVFFHLSAHSLPVSLNSRRSSKVQGRARSEHCNKCAGFSVASPHTHVVSPS